MWRSPPSRLLLLLLLRSLLGADSRSPPRPCARLSSAAPSHQPPPGEEQRMSVSEAKKLMRLVNVEALKKKLETEREEVIGYAELLEAREGVGVARTREEAAAFARILDEAGVVLLFRDKVYLHPDKVPVKQGLSLIRGDASATCSASDVDQLKSVQADLREFLNSTFCHPILQK